MIRELRLSNQGLDECMDSDGSFEYENVLRCDGHDDDYDDSD